MARSSVSFAGSSASGHARRRNPVPPHGVLGRGEQLALPGSGVASPTDRSGSRRRVPRRPRTCQGSERSPSPAIDAPGAPSASTVIGRDPTDAVPVSTLPSSGPDRTTGTLESGPPPRALAGGVFVVWEPSVVPLWGLGASARSAVTAFRSEVRLTDLAAGAVAVGAFGLWALVLGLLGG